MMYLPSLTIARAVVRDFFIIKIRVPKRADTVLLCILRYIYAWQ